MDYFDFFLYFVSSTLGQNLDFWQEIQLFDTFQGDITKKNSDLWHKNSNLSKSKVWSKLNFWTKIKKLCRKIFFMVFKNPKIMFLGCLKFPKIMFLVCP